MHLDLKHMYAHAKSLVSQIILNFKFSKNNIIEHNVTFSKDTRIDGGAIIGENTVLGHGVIICKNVHISKNAMLSKIEIGENSAIEYGVICTGNGQGKILIGKESYIGIRIILDWSDNITIGNYVGIGSSTAIWTHNNVPMCINNIPLANQNNKTHRPTAPVLIEDNVWIGGNCTIYPGVVIHHHSIIAPNSAVAHDVESYSMVGGVPAKLIKKLSVS